LLQPGTIVAGYRIDGLLGEGGMAVVYRATQLSLERVVALKLLAAELSDDPSFRARFKREGQLQAGLDHQHIVAVYEAGESEHGLFLAMRLIPGATLKQLILGRELDPRRTLRLLTQVAQALDAAHEKSLIHRDVKPQNILIDRGDHVYLADFGLTKAMDDTAGLTGTGQFLGTIDYVAPEQIQGLQATGASDCYALTAVLYECLTGQVPYLEPNEAAVLHAHVVKPPPRVTDLRPELPAALDEVIAAGMAKDPTARPSPASELVRSAARALAPGSPEAAPAQQTVLSDPRSGSASPLAGEPAGATRLAGTPAALASARGGDHAATAAPAQPRRVLAAGAAPLLAALAVAALVGGFLVGKSGQSSASSRLTNSALAGHLLLNYPPDWRLGTAPAVAGLTFSEPLSLTAGQPGAGLIAGELHNAAGSTLLASGFRSRVQGALPPGEAVKLGAVEAYRYPGLHVAGTNGALTLYAAPTSAGVATVICKSANAAASAFQSQCAHVVSTLRLAGAVAYPLTPIASYAERLSAAFAQLQAALPSQLAVLQAPPSTPAQARAAQQLAAAYSKAAGELSIVAVSPLVGSAHELLVAALTAVSRSYGRAARAALSGSAAAYTGAGRELASASASLGSALHALGALGYTVPR
jgi:Protein kinase domain